MGTPDPERPVTGSSPAQNRFIQLDGSTYTAIDYNALFAQERRMVIIAGTSITWMPQALRFFAAQGIGTVIISFDPQEPMTPQGMVRMDYVNAMHTLLTYLSDCGRSQIACFGFNPNSSADAIKQRYFEIWNHAHGNNAGSHLFLNLGSLDTCYAQFRASEGFDAVICANDIVAVFLIKRLKDSGISVPEQMYVAAFGNSLLAQRVHPTITTASLDHYEMGRQAVILYAHLYRQKASASMSVRVHSQLMIRESTALIPMHENRPGHPICDGGDVMNVDFYSDQDVMRLSLAEQLLHACDAADEALLRGILRGDGRDAVPDGGCAQIPQKAPDAAGQVRDERAVSGLSALLQGAGAVPVIPQALILFTNEKGTGRVRMCQRSRLSLSP